METRTATGLGTIIGIKLEVSGRLIVEACSLSYGISFSPSALMTVHDMIRLGISIMVNNGEEETPLKLLEAQSNLANFICALAIEAKAQNYIDIERHHVLSMQQSKFCPVYPFT